MATKRLAKLDIASGFSCQVRTHNGERFIMIGPISGGNTIIRSYEYTLKDDKSYSLKIDSNELYLFEKEKE